MSHSRTVWSMEAEATISNDGNVNKSSTMSVCDSFNGLCQRAVATTTTHTPRHYTATTARGHTHTTTHTPSRESPPMWYFSSMN